jgi:cytoskeletal protein CcmA (bactofilin family)
VESGAVLIARSVRVEGNIQAENADQVTVTTRSVVNGGIQIKQSGGVMVADTRIGGDLQLEENRRSLLSQGNTIGGNLQAFENEGGLRVSSNRIDGNLQCKENRPTPSGNGNMVRGKKEDQCARF